MSNRTEYTKYSIVNLSTPATNTSLPERANNNDKYWGPIISFNIHKSAPPLVSQVSPQLFPLTILYLRYAPTAECLVRNKQKKVWLGTAFLFNGFHQVGETQLQQT